MSFLTLLGGIPGLIKLLIIGSLVGTILYYVGDYKAMAVANTQLRNDVVRLEGNIKSFEVEKENLIQSVNASDKVCGDQLKRFLDENDIWKRLEESKTPMDDAANWAVQPDPSERKK